MLHKYIFDGTRIVLDVNSGAVHVVDQLVWDILDIYPEAEEKLIETFISNYSQEEIKQALSEIDTLVAENLLFTKDAYEAITSLILRRWLRPYVSMQPTTAT
ncbi:hypothetical protein N752_04050 [Desulforamulus aquiferis]|nr:hypothetical protein N752_04050 [Desulforamulus aquiferis]